MIEEFNEYNEINLWGFLEENNIIIPDACLNLIKVKKYPDNILLSNTIYITQEKEIFEFNDWLKFFEVDEIKEEIQYAGFDVEQTIINEDGSLAVVGKK